MKRLLLITTALASLSFATPAHAGPAAPAFMAFATWLTGSTIAAMAARFVITTALSFAVSKLLAPKMPGGQERQAAVLSLSLGEEPRRAIFGRACTGGQLLDAYNYGGTNKTDWEVLVIKVADHKCDALEGFFIGDAYHAFAGDGVQAGFNGQLEVYWKNGDPAQTASSFLLSTSSQRLYGQPWTSDDVFASMAYVIVAYKADDPKSQNPVWPQGRPQFRFVVRGKLCYDPRKDSTVPGGSGAHRWTNPATWEWTDNARVCDYNYDRGVYAKDQVSDPAQLLIGRGLSAEEAPPERVFAAANVCDELVPLKAGGTEKRYRVGGVVFADESFITVKERFAAAMAGEIVKRNGGVEVEPGQAKATVAEITDADLVPGEPVGFEAFLSDNDRVNTVIPRYVEPTQLWKDHAAPVRRSTADIVADGGLKTEDLSLSMVTSGTQAQRCGEIRRRMNRKERRASVVLPPPFSNLEDGDWIGFTSQRLLNGSRVVFRVEVVAVRENYRTAVVLREISADCFSWNAATDESTPGQAPVDNLGSLDALQLAGVSITSVDLEGAAGVIQPGIKAVWTTPVDPAISAVVLEVRKQGEPQVATTRQDNPNAGVIFTTNGVPSGVNAEARLVPISTEGRLVAPSPWVVVVPGDLTAGGDGADIPSPNLWRKQDYVPSGGASVVDPAFGTSNWGFRFPQTAGAVTVSGEIFATQADGGRYAVAFLHKLSSGTGTATVRVGFRTNGGAAISDLPDQVVTVGTTEQRFVWNNIRSADPNFVTAKFQIFTNAGDVAAGKAIDVSDVVVVYGNTAPLGFAPCPDDPEALRLFGYTGVFDATKNIIHRQQAQPASPSVNDLWVQLDGGGAPVAIWIYNGAAWVKPADLTAANTAAAIAGQGAFATLSQATWATHITGVGKPEDFATRSRVFRQQSQPSGPTLNDIWVQTNGSGTPVAVFAWNGSSWVKGGDVTAFFTASAIQGQGPWATETGVTPDFVNGKLRYISTDGRMWDYRGIGYGWSIDGVAGRQTQPLSSTDTTITVQAHTVYFPAGSSQASVNIPSGTFSGLDPNTTYGVFYHQPTGFFAVDGPSVSWQHFSSPVNYLHVGFIRTAVAGGGSYNPPPYGNGGVVEYCVDAEAFLGEGRKAGSAAVGDPLLMLTLAGDEVYAGRIERAVLAIARRVRLRTARGGVLTVSDTAPLMTRDAPGELPYPIKAAEARVGMAVPIAPGFGAAAPEWDILTGVEPLPEGQVVRISAGDGIFAATDHPDAPPIFTHNGYSKP